VAGRMVPVWHTKSTYFSSCVANQKAFIPHHGRSSELLSREPVVSFAGQGHKPLEVPYCGSIHCHFKLIATITGWRKTMVEDRYKVRRTNPRFSFFANAEVTLRDGTGVRAQIAELSSRGCYIDALEPIPLRTKLRLSICDGTRTCDVQGRVLYMHSGGGFGIFGMGVLFEEMEAEQKFAIDKWLRELAVRQGNDLRNNSFSQVK